MPVIPGRRHQRPVNRFTTRKTTLRPFELESLLLSPSKQTPSEADEIEVHSPKGLPQINTSVAADILHSSRYGAAFSPQNEQNLLRRGGPQNAMDRVDSVAARESAANQNATLLQSVQDDSRKRFRSNYVQHVFKESMVPSPKDQRMPAEKLRNNPEHIASQPLGTDISSAGHGSTPSVALLTSEHQQDSQRPRRSLSQKNDSKHVSRNDSDHVSRNDRVHSVSSWSLPRPRELDPSDMRAYGNKASSNTQESGDIRSYFPSVRLAAKNNKQLPSTAESRPGGILHARRTLFLTSTPIGTPARSTVRSGRLHPFRSISAASMLEAQPIENADRTNELAPNKGTNPRVPEVTTSHQDHAKKPRMDPVFMLEPLTAHSIRMEAVANRKRAAPKRGNRPLANDEVQATEHVLLWKGVDGERRTTDVTDLDVVITMLKEASFDMRESISDVAVCELIEAFEASVVESILQMLHKIQQYKQSKKKLAKAMRELKALEAEVGEAIENKIRSVLQQRRQLPPGESRR